MSRQPESNPNLGLVRAVAVPPARSSERQGSAVRQLAALRFALRARPEVEGRECDPGGQRRELQVRAQESGRDTGRSGGDREAQIFHDRFGPGRA